MTDTEPDMRNGAGSGSEGETADTPTDLGERIKQKRLDSLHWTELGLSERVWELHGDDIRHVEGKGFAVWDAKHWGWDLSGNAMRAFVQDTFRSLGREIGQHIADAKSEDDKEAKRKMMGWLLKCESLAYSKNAVTWLAANREANVPVTLFDSDPYLYNATNGTVDLRTGKLREFAKGDFLTKLGSVVHDPNATCERWRSFLRWMFNGDEVQIAALQRWLGYCFTGVNTEQKFMILDGTGRNGKTTLLSTFAYVMGDEYADEIDSKILMSSNLVSDYNTKATMAAVMGHRMLTTTEVMTGSTLEASLLKNITGGEKVVAGYKMKQPFNYKPTFKIVISVNKLPDVRDHTLAMWRRVIRVPVLVTISEADKDDGLPNSLKREASGILNWAIEGCLAWQKQGLDIPAQWRDAATRYESDTDIIGQFLYEECLVPGDGNPEPDEYKVSFGKLYRTYTDWIARNETSDPVSQRDFSQELELRQFTKGRSNKDRYFKGLTVKTARDRNDAPVSAVWGSDFDGDDRAR